MTVASVEMTVGYDEAQKGYIVTLVACTWRTWPVLRSKSRRNKSNLWCPMAQANRFSVISIYLFIYFYFFVSYFLGFAGLKLPFQVFHPQTLMVACLILKRGKRFQRF